jgi:hypothetical protein
MTEVYEKKGEQPQPSLSDFDEKLGELIEAMKNISRSSTMPDARDYFPEEITELTVMCQKLGGLAVEGKSWSSDYYVAPPVQGTFERGRLGYAKHRPHDFRGRLGSLATIPVETTLGGPSTFLCLSVLPLGFKDRSIRDYFTRRGWDSELHHPFGMTTHTDTPLWLSVQGLQPNSLEPLHMPGNRASKD